MFAGPVLFEIDFPVHLIHLSCIVVAEMLSARHWERQAHDCQTGSITAMSASFDDSYLISAAQDGTLYIYVSHSTYQCKRKP